LKGFGCEEFERFVGFEGFSESKLAQGASKALEFGFWYLELGIWNLELGTWNLEFETWNSTTEPCQKS
jgi:hypothetical protein